MKLQNTKLFGCYLITNEEMFDNRGSFTKLFNDNFFREHGIDLSSKEQFISVSKKFVLRGMHFQTPPYDQNKLVTCLKGSVLDVLLDLRIGSPTFGQNEAFELNEKCIESVFVPTGLAHGFLSLEDNTTMLYNTSSLYAPKSDSGIMWDSFDFDWPCKVPIISKRDSNHPNYKDFLSPFKL